MISTVGEGYLQDAILFATRNEGLYDATFFIKAFREREIVGLFVSTKKTWFSRS